MAKKVNKPDVSGALALIEEIEYDIICRLEISISNNILIDGKDVISINGKPICYPKDSYDNYNIIKFDPFWNRKLTNLLFERFIRIYSMEHPDIQINSFFLTMDLSRPNEVFAICRTNRGDIESNKFVNETVCWIDLIYKMEYCPYSFSNMKDIDNTISFLKTERKK